VKGLFARRVPAPNRPALLLAVRAFLRENIIHISVKQLFLKILIELVPIDGWMAKFPPIIWQCQHFPPRGEIKLTKRQSDNIHIAILVGEQRKTTEILVAPATIQLTVTACTNKSYVPCSCRG
jgi:hypothetical protein